MVDYKLIERSDAGSVYEYAIEGDAGDTGRISLEAGSRAGAMLDHEGSMHHKLYASKLISHLGRLAESGSLPDAGTYMWY